MKNSPLIEDIVEEAPLRAQTPLSTPDPEAKADAGTRPKQDRRRSIFSRIALRMTPLYGSFYDWQMARGDGVQLVRHRMQLPQYPSGAPSLRVVFLSDLHYGPTTGSVAPRQAWRLAREAKPDVLLLGGDYLYADESGLPALLRELQRWQRDPPPGGIYACLGNHDLLANSEAIVMCLEACNVRVLVNNACELPAPWRGVWIAGTDDHRRGNPQPGPTLDKTPRDACRILLAHSPDICDSNAPARCSLTLCGHTHGGQICMPNGEPLYVPGHSKWSRQYHAGLFRHAGHWLYVSRGVGTVGLPLRMWCPPEITVFDLIARGTTR